MKVALSINGLGRCLDMVLSEAKKHIWYWIGVYKAEGTVLLVPTTRR